MKILKHIAHLIPIVILGICCFLYPKWYADGLLEDWYPRIGAAISVYGGFIGFLVWYIRNFYYL